MTIVVEDGSNVADANSFVSLADVKAYASARGYTLTGTDSVIEGNIIQSTDYLITLDDAFRGQRANDDQPLPFPRKCMYVGNSITVFPDNEIPTQLKSAQCELTYQICNGVNPFPTQTGSFVTMEKLDVLETHYSEHVSTSGIPSIPLVDALLAPLLNESAFSVKVVRV